MKILQQSRSTEIIETERGFNEKLKEKDLVIEKLKEEMEKHVRCFNMEGLTTKIMNTEA